MEYSVVLFYSNNHAVWCKDLLDDHKIDNKMVSVPRELSSDCGYCVKFNRADLESVLKILSDSTIEYDRVESI